MNLLQNNILCCICRLGSLQSLNGGHYLPKIKFRKRRKLPFQTVMSISFSNSHLKKVTPPFIRENSILGACATLVRDLVEHKKVLCSTAPCGLETCVRLKQLRRIITLDSIRETFSLWTDSAEKWYQTVKRENYIFFTHFSQLNPRVNCG